MKIRLRFESMEEFIQFLLSISAVEVKDPSKLFFSRVHYQLEEVRVLDRTYSVRGVKNAGAVDCVLKNFAIHPLHNRQLYLRIGPTNYLGPEEVVEKLRIDGVPEKFVLVTGWKTDHCWYLFSTTD